MLFRATYKNDRCYLVVCSNSFSLDCRLYVIVSVTNTNYCVSLAICCTYTSVIYLFIMSSYTKYKYNRTQNTGKMKKKLKTTVKNKEIK